MSEFVVGRRQLYIIPTRIGWYYSLILLALFAIAVKYNNQAAFMMLFILVAIALIGMIQTNNNVISLELRSRRAVAIFAGEKALFPVQLINNSNQVRQAVWLSCGGFNQVTNLDPGENKELKVAQASVQRGYLRCEPLFLCSQFPLGLFFCWSKCFQSTQRCIVYPQPLDIVQLTDYQNQDSTEQSVQKALIHGEDYSGMKPYQDGDRPRDIHWPSLAKTHKLVSIQHDDRSTAALKLSWFALPDKLNIEDKLSQLCHWVIEAEKHQHRYQLEMPNHTIGYGRGNAHYHKCLVVLALWQIDEPFGSSADQSK